MTFLKSTVEDEAKARKDHEELYTKAVDIVVRSQRANISLVQGALLIGYNRAARLLEQMEIAEVVTPANGSGIREVIAPLSKDGVNQGEQQ